MDLSESYRWIDESTGLQCEASCVITTHRTWWCGYVRPPQGCPDFDDYKVSMHGGITYPSDGRFDPTRGDTRAGFDCAHHGDDEMSWTLEKIKDECANIAQQIVVLVGPLVMMLDGVTREEGP